MEKCEANIDARGEIGNQPTKASHLVHGINMSEQHYTRKWESRVNSLIKM